MAEPSNENHSNAAFESLHILIQRWKEGTFGEILNDWLWIFSYSRKYTAAILIYTILGIVSTSLSLIGSVISKHLIDIITGYQSDKLAILLSAMIGSSVFSLLFHNFTNRISTRLSIRINNDIQADIFEQILDSDWLSLSQYSNGDILNRFNSDISTISENAISWLPKIVIALYNFAATFIVIWYYNKIMALIAFASAPFLLFFSKLILKKQRDYRKKVREMNSQMVSFEVESFYNIDTVKSFGIADLYVQKLRNWQEKYKVLFLKYNLFSIETNILMNLMGLAVQMLGFIYCLWLLWKHQITYGTMTLFLAQRANLSSSLDNIIGIIPSFLNSSVSAHRIKELVFLPREEHIERSTELEPYKNDGLSIQMKKICFGYSKERPIIQDSDFSANPGEIVALIGPSGEGKTTMIRLILGLLHPDIGTVSVSALNGVEIPSNANIRHLFSYVPQGNTLIAGTISENMRLAKPDATDEEIIEALQIGCAWDFVQKLPQGIETQIKERGRGLSEGQAQRISIARAILRDAPILLLDEATSALDVSTERNVLRSIIRQKPNKVCIVTTHRPTVLTMCQRVYRVMDTKIVELNAEESSRMAMDF